MDSRKEKRRTAQTLTEVVDIQISWKQIYATVKRVDERGRLSNCHSL